MENEYPNGTRMWFEVGYTVRFDGEVSLVPEGSEALEGGFSVEEGTVIMFPNGDVVFYTGVTTTIVNREDLKEVEIQRDDLTPEEKVFWRKYPVEQDTEFDEE